MDTDEDCSVISDNIIVRGTIIVGAVLETVDIAEGIAQDGGSFGTNATIQTAGAIGPIGGGSEAEYLAEKSLR
ncbi:MAG: hypothetical protein AB3N16_15070 [Flavobacteriaceae bacterium]